MKFKFTQFGYIDKGEVELADLTILCGKNNVGKTYISYATYGFFKKLQRLAEFHIEKHQMDELEENGAIQIDLLGLSERIQSCFKSASDNFTNGLEGFFNAPDDYFQNTKIEFVYDDFKPDFSSLFKVRIS